VTVAVSDKRLPSTMHQYSRPSPEAPHFFCEPRPLSLSFSILQHLCLIIRIYRCLRLITIIAIFDILIPVCTRYTTRLQSEPSQPGMAASDIQARWGFDAGPESAFTVDTGVMIAAANDNVQVLAIMACEKFGNTLAIWPETCHKIEIVVLPTPRPVTLTFLWGVVGLTSHDCATQLGKSAAGVRFLGLVSALSTTLDLFAAPNALKMMLSKSTTDLTLIPTARQLKDLLAILHPRLYRCSFPDDIIKWRTLLYNKALPHIWMSADLQDLTKGAHLIPYSTQHLPLRWQRI
jgi:hypothetical protein